MTIFLLPTTEKNTVPSAAESKALSLAHRQISEGNPDAARTALFAAFSPAAAEQHFEEIRRRFAPKASVISEPGPRVQSSPLLRLVKYGLIAGAIFLAYSALTNR